MSETIPQSQYERELWQRVQLEQLIGTEAVRRIGLYQGDYVNKHNVQLEIDYGMADPR